MKLIFWLTFGMLFYCFIGYAVLIWLLVQLKGLFVSKKLNEPFELPEMSFVVAAYNESAFIETKIQNTLSVKYPEDKLKLIFITDGSDDGTREIVQKYPQIINYHQQGRKGKAAALNRVMETITTPIVVFSDANTNLNKNALISLAIKYADAGIGGVSGEKKVVLSTSENQQGIGEGLYWKYESFLKKQESQFYSIVGSAGELFSIRTALFKPIPSHIILDDFYTALTINQQGYKIAYEPGAFAIETPSASLADEQVRKVRIAAGAFQVSFKFTGLLNFFKHPAFSFQYFSHKILRWYFAPVSIILLLVSNYYNHAEADFYRWFWYAQLAFYCIALMGWILQKAKRVIPLFYFPFYFLFMNYCTVVGLYRYLSGKQNVLWKKSKRETTEDKPINQ
ncbi:MAG: glycosyltransferase family 2 protein [Sphingobacteriales bacterium]|nr:glycosyltransferase family 2 protein [Sphingobacteriales bacterium]MBI3717615.1 glycosyltransferase family 2 protein [Sphingobacteriales bacterium]